MAKSRVSLQDLKEKFKLSDEFLNRELSEEHLNDVSRIIDDHKILGAELGFTTGEMTAIRKDTESHELQKLELLKKWKQSWTWKATYEELIKALLKCSRADHARDVCQLLAQSAHPSIGPDETQRGDQLERSPSDSLLAQSNSREKHPQGHLVEVLDVVHLDLGQVEEEQDIIQLEKKVKEMKNMFDALRKAAFEDLEKRRVPISKLRKSLCVRHEIREAETVHHLYAKCWDFLNPGLLKRIIDSHCSESLDIQDQKKEYLKKLKDFRKTTIARQFAKVDEVTKQNIMCSEVVFEMGKDWDNATLEDVEGLKHEVCAQGYLTEHTFNFKQPNNSSISLAWTSPCSCHISTTTLRIPPSFYLEHGIRRVLVKGVCVVDVKSEKEQEAAAKQEESFMKTIEAIASEERAERLIKQSQEKLFAAIKEDETMRHCLEDEVKKSEQRKKIARHVSEGHLSHTMEQESALKKKDSKPDYEEKMTHLITKILLLAQQEAKEREHEAKERELLQVLKVMKGVEGRKLTPPTGDHFVEYEGIRYNKKLGGANGNTKEMMILVSVGSEFPAGVQVHHRVRKPDLAKKAIEVYGPLPHLVTGLHEEAAADLMATASLRLQPPNADLVRLCLDVPGKQRSKEYYLSAIENFLKHCQQPLAVLIYMGHSEEGTGNWCFKDGTITFQEVFDLYKKHRRRNRITIQSDCCYSGQWVKDCAEMLDSLGIPPCGHRAREQGILIKVYASCQPHQKAAEPCYSLEGVTLCDDGTVGHYAWKQASDETQRFCGTDFTKLACCRDPNESCRSEETLKNWTWKDAVNDGLKKRVIIVRGTKRGKPVWYYVLLSSEVDEERLKQVRLGITDVGKLGYILASGCEEDPGNISSWISV